jgi:hypothetical protein
MTDDNKKLFVLEDIPFYAKTLNFKYQTNTNSNDTNIVAYHFKSNTNGEVTFFGIHLKRSSAETIHMVLQQQFQLMGLNITSTT